MLGRGLAAGACVAATALAAAERKPAKESPGDSPAVLGGLPAIRASLTGLSGLAARVEMPMARCDEAPPVLAEVMDPPPPPMSAADEDALSVLAGDAAEVAQGKAVAPPDRWEIFTQEPLEATHPAAFEGFRGFFVRQNTPLFAFSHQLYLGSGEMPPLYQFGAVLGTDLATGSHIRADMDHGGSLMLNGLLIPAGMNLTVKPSLQLATAPDGKRVDQMGVDAVFKGRDWVGEGGIKYGAAEKAATLRFLQAVNPAITLGVSSTFSEGGSASMEGVARFTRFEHSMLQAQMKPGALDVAYVREVVPNRIAVGTELNLRTANVLDPNWRVGGQFRFKQSTVQTSIDRDGGVKTVVELKPKPMFQVQLSANVNTWKDTYKFGVGFMLSL